MAGDDADKTEDPTGKKLSDARSKGQVPQSQELSAFIMLVVAASALLILGPYMGERIADLMQRQFQIDREHIFDPSFMLLMLKSAFLSALTIAAPMYAIMVVAAFIGPVYMSGFLFSTSVMRPKFSKLNPITGIKRLFGVQGLVNLGKAILKVLLVGSFLIFFMYTWLPELLITAQEPMKQAFAHVLYKVFLFFLILSLSLILIVLIDVPFQRWNNKRQLKMSKQEVKDEHKNSEGAPEIKQRIRQAQQDAAQRRMMNKVPEADVVITNPTHFAVALIYDELTMGAPVVVAKGADLIAAQIRSRALGANVPLIQIPPLARALYHSTELDQPIPSGLYLAVAKILAYVFQLRQAGVGPSPPIPDDLNIPDEFLR